jgi:hypothetical protein
VVVGSVIPQLARRVVNTSKKRHGKRYSSPIREIWRTNNIASCEGVTREKCENEEGGGSSEVAEKTHIDFVELGVSGAETVAGVCDLVLLYSHSAYSLQIQIVASPGLSESRSELDSIMGVQIGRPEARFFS